MATEAEIGGIISPTHLTELFDMGFTKLVPISKDGVTPIIKWTPIYDNPNYWTKEKLVKQAADFKHGVGTIFCNTGLSNDQGLLYLNNLDIDSDAVYDKLFVLQNPGQNYSLDQLRNY